MPGATPSLAVIRGAGRAEIHRTERGRIVNLAEGASEWAPVAGRRTNATQQFDIADERSPREIAALLEQIGYEAVWKDWDASLGEEELQSVATK